MEHPTIVPDNPRPEATFDRCALTTLAKARDILSQRSSDYLDTWSLANIVTPFLDHSLSLVLNTPATTPERLKEWTRIVAMGSLCDVKISRLIGPFREDTPIDLINYIAAWTTLVTEYLHAR